jgi:hypothetical protein
MIGSHSCRRGRARAKAQRRKVKKRNFENVIAAELVDAAFKIHTILGPGLLESVYQTVLAHEMARRGFTVRREVPIPVVYEGLRFDVDFARICSSSAS